LQVFSIKKDEVHIQFKTLPGDKIIGVQLGGLPGNGYYFYWIIFFLYKIINKLYKKEQPLIKYLLLVIIKFVAIIKRENYF